MSSPSKRHEERRRQNHRPTMKAGGGGSGSRGHHDASPPHPPQQQQRQRHPNEPPSYSRYSVMETLEKRWEPKSSQTIAPAFQNQRHQLLQQQQQSAHNSSPKRGSLNASTRSSFAEKRRLQERREFDNAFWPSTEAAGSVYNDHSQPPNNEDTLQMNNYDLKQILPSAVGATATAAASSINNEIMPTTSNDGACAEVVNKTSITLENYSLTGKRLSNSSRQKFVVDAGASAAAAGDGGSSLAPSSAVPAAGAMKPSSILKRTSTRPSSILKTTSYSSSAAQPSLSSIQQHQVHSNNKVDWGDNSTREIENRLSPVMFNVPAANPPTATAHAAGSSNNSYNRRKSDNLPPNNNNNFIRRGSGGAHPPPPLNSNNNFNRRSSGNGGSGGGSRPTSGFNAPCRLEEHKDLHKWKDCPNNPHSENYNHIHHRTASHQQLLDSVQLERQQFEKRQQQLQQRQQKMNMSVQEANANGSRGEQNPPSVVASSSLKRPTAASIPNPSSSALAAARRSSEASNLFNTSKSARTQTASQHPLKFSAIGGSSIPRSPIPKKQTVTLPETQKLRHLKQTNEMHSSIMHAIPRKPQQKHDEPRMQQQKNVEFKNGRFQKKTSIDVAPSGQDAVPIAKQTSGRLVTKAKKPSSWPRGDGACNVAHRINNDNNAGKDDDTDESHHTIMDDEMEVDDFSNNDLIDNDNGDKEEAGPATSSNSSSIGLKITRDPGKDSGSSDCEKKKKKTRDDDDEKKEDKKTKESKKKKEKKKAKKECKKPGCTMKRVKGNKFCQAHATVSKKSDAAFADTSSAGGIDSLLAKSVMPAALEEAENGPRKKVKAKKRGVKRKSPPEPTLDVPSLNDDKNAPAISTSSANKRRAQEICRRSDNLNPPDQLANDDDEILPDLEDGDIGEMETDLFYLLDETIKIRYQDYVEQNKINEDLLSEEQPPLEIRTGEDESPPDKSSFSNEVPSQNGVETKDKENTLSALRNSLTDSASRNACDESEDDDQIPLFYTCEKCDRVFFAKTQATDHENQCTKEVLDGREFSNTNDIAEYYEKNQTGGEMKSDCVIFYRPPLTTSHTNSGRTISPEDFDGRGGNRNDLPQNLLGDFISSKSPKATSVTKEQKIETEFKIDPNNTRHECEVMNAIERLSTTVINPDSGLPRQTITTLCSETETLYDFLVEIKPSNIPNSGLGAFLTFLGARVLQQSASARCARLLEEHNTYDETGNLFVKTHEELTAEVYGGRKVHVTLRGNNLHHNDNSLYWSKERQSYLKKHIEENGTLLDHFDEDEICCRVNSEVKKLKSKIPEGERIGFLEIHSESDYVDDKSLVFSSEKKGLGMLEIGRYGPHLRNDVKYELHFNFKNFIFDFEPSEWSYGTTEQRLGRDQAIDITDDATGEIHSIARQCTPIYVNEVGYDKKLHCNVEIRHKNERSVYYYVFIDKDHAMKAGDQVELLVNYGDAYEDVRERKGYGKDNNEIYGGDHDDAAARLKRNFIDRDMAQLDISDLKLFDMFYLVEYLTNDVLDPIDQRIRGSFSSSGQAISFTRLSKDIVARQRMHWLKMKLICRLEEMIAHPDPEDKLLVHTMARGGKEMVTAIEKSLLKWEFAMLPDIFSRLNSVSNGGEKTLQDVILVELSEELLHSVSSKLPDPLNSTMWSKISVDLTESTARDIARYLVCCKGPMYSRQLTEQLLVNAKNAANRVREASHIVNNKNSYLSGERASAIDNISFHSLRRKLKKKDVSPNGSLINVYVNDLNLPHGTAATIADIQAYQDAVELGYLEPYYDPCSTRKLTDSKLSIVSQYASCNHTNGSQQFHWMARSIDAFENGVARVNEQWYLLNQVLLPVYTLASGCFEWNDWSKEFCEAIGVELDAAKETLERGVVRPNWPEEVENKSSDSTKTKKKGRLRGCLSNEARTLKNCACEEFPGWTIESIQRRNSHHVDSYWSHPGLGGIVLRSKVGVKEMIAKMETNLIDANTAYNILVSEGKKKYFGGRKS